MRRCNGFALLISTLVCSSSACAPSEVHPSLLRPDVAPPIPPQVNKLTDEAGFLEVPRQVSGAVYHGRLFYSFRPAEHDPRHAPVLVLFNGGPGFAVSGGLMSFGTGPLTLTADMEADDPPVDNPARLSRFANLLYLDPRKSGFSYDLADSLMPWRIGEACSGHTGTVGDAADFVYALLGFLDSHVMLTANPVVLVGESYGGTRSALMLHLLQHYADGHDPKSGEPDQTVVPWLRDRMQVHLDLAYPERRGEIFGPDKIAEQFGWQVLIEPNIGGESQTEFEGPYLEEDMLLQGYYAGADLDNPPNSFDVRFSDAEMLRIFALPARALVDPAGFKALVGVAPSDVPGLAPKDRVHSYRGPDDDVMPEDALSAALGELQPWDYYWAPSLLPCGHWLGDASSAKAFLSQTRRTRAFITRARYDSAVYMPAFPGFLALWDNHDVSTDETPRPGVERPGWINIAYRTGEHAEIRFPLYDAGHMVPMTAAAEFAHDVRAWLVETGALAE